MTGNQCRTDGCTRPAAPDRATCHTCRTRTRPPKAHIPELEVIDAAISDRRPARGLCRRDSQLVSRQLTAHGVSAAEIGRIVGRSPRTIARWRAADRASLNRLVQSIAETITDAADPSQYALAADSDSATN